MRAKTLGFLFLLSLLAFMPRGFQGGAVLVTDTALFHQAFVDCNNLNVRKVAKMTKANWRWMIVLHDWDRDGLKNDILFLGNGSRHRVAPHPPEQANNPLARIEIDQVCDNAPGQAARVPQRKTAQATHGNHTDFIQMRVDAQPVGVRISVQLDHLLPDSSAVPLDSVLTQPGDCNANEVPDDEEAEGASDQNENSILDECESDSNDNGIPDDLDPEEQDQQDCNDDTIPDDLELSLGIAEDANEDGIPDSCQAAPGRSNMLVWILIGVAVLALAVLAWFQLSRRAGPREG